jgi:C-terminal processing protease CtpA/Prc
MVCAFARERGLATIVGTETAGRLIPGSGFKVGHGYVAIFPRAAYITWEGRTFEGQRIVPDHLVPWSFEEHRLGRDNQLRTALRILNES